MVVWELLFCAIYAQVHVRCWAVLVGVSVAGAEGADFDVGSRAVFCDVVVDGIAAVASGYSD